MSSVRIAYITVSLAIILLSLLQQGDYWYTWFLVRRSGILNNAIVISKRKRNKRGKTVYIKYRFEVGEERQQTRSFEQEVRVQESAFQNLSDGSTILVKYFPNNPKRSRIVGDTFTVNTMIRSGILLIGYTLFVIVLAIRLKQANLI